MSCASSHPPPPCPRPHSKPPLIVNSLLCFLHNFRDHPHIRVLINEYFTSGEIDEAKELLTRRTKLSTTTVTSECDIFVLYESLRSEGQLPLFAASNLAAMPLALFADSGKDEIIREVRTLRRYMCDALNGRIEEGLSSYTRIYESEDYLEMPSHGKQMQSHSSGQRHLSSQCYGQTEKTTSSLPFSTTPKDSPHKAMSFSHFDSSLISGALSPPTASTPHKRRRRVGVRSLDAAVAKLNDLQRSSQNRSEPPREVSPAVGSSAEVSLNDNLLLSPAVAVLPPSSALSSIWPIPEAINPHTQAYFNILRSAMSASPVTLVQSVAISAASLSPPQSESAEKLAKLEEDEKVDEMEECNESSPSPSEETREDLEDNETEKPFTCDYTNCTKRFANKFLLKKHTFIHTGLRPHTCPFCNKSFNRKDNLLRHKKTHMNQDDMSRRAALNLFMTTHEMPPFRAAEEDE